jgi:hypothetical protein
MRRTDLALGFDGCAVNGRWVDDLVVGDLSLMELARLYRKLADHAASDEATTYTDDGLFAATTRLSEALAANVGAASHIRGARRRPSNRATDAGAHRR